jgi:hypothetical protein
MNKKRRKFRNKKENVNKKRGKGRRRMRDKNNNIGKQRWFLNVNLFCVSDKYAAAIFMIEDSFTVRVDFESKQMHTKLGK